MSDGVSKEGSISVYEQAGLTRKMLGNLEIFTLDTTGANSSKNKLNSLKELINLQRVAVEAGPDNQVDSLIFAAQHSNADVVIGIDPNFDFAKVSYSSSVSDSDKKPQIILLKGNAENIELRDLFNGQSEDKANRLPVYTQLVAPDSDYVERMIDSTISLSHDGYMVVLDPRTTELLGNNYYPEGDIQGTILKERGIQNPSHLDNIKSRLRGSNVMEISSEDYTIGVKQGKYPQTSFAGSGNMLVFERLTSST